MIRSGRDGMARPAGWALAATITALLALGYVLRYTLLPFAMMAALAFALMPIVQWLRRRLHLPRIAAVLVVYLVILAGAGLTGAYLVGVAGDRAAKAVADAPHLITEQIRHLIGPQVHVFGHAISADDLATRIVDGVKAEAARPAAALTAGGLVVGAPAVLVFMLVVLFYFLASGRQLLDGLLWLAPPRYRGHLGELGERIEPMLRHYVRGVILVTLYTSGVAWLVLGWWFHLPFAVLVSIAVGVFEIVPVVGPAVSMVLIGVVALIQGGGLWTFLGFMAFAVALRVSIDNLVGPLVLGHAVTLHPVVVIFAFLVGASLFGVLGVFVAVPVAATVKIVLTAWYDEEESEPDAQTKTN